MSFATLAFAQKGTPFAKFRIDPSQIDWSYQVHTNIIPTVGGRVVQVTGATLSDMVINGYFGEDKSQHDGTTEPPGRSWRLAVAFSNQIRKMMVYQSSDATQQHQMHETAIFTYAPLGWKFRVYIKSFADPDGGAINIRPGKFSHAYSLTLFIVQDGSDQVNAQGNGVLTAAKSAAINQYISRLADGIGWTPSSYQGNFQNYYAGEYNTTPHNNTDDVGNYLTNLGATS